jgi:hypothetical protein
MYKIENKKKNIQAYLITTVKTIRMKKLRNIMKNIHMVMLDNVKNHF